MKLLIACLLLLSSSVLRAEDVWVGAYVMEGTDKHPNYWLGTIEKEEYDGLLAGTRTTGWFALRNVCYWDSTEEGNKVTWFVRQQKDESDSGVLVFRRERLDRLVLLNGDPKAVRILKDKEGNRIGKENW